MLLAACLIIGVSVAACGDPHVSDPDQELHFEGSESVEVMEKAIHSASLNPRRSLIETNQALLSPWTMESILQVIAENGELFSAPFLTYNLLFNLYNDTANTVFPDISAEAPHAACDDPRHQQMLNNFPLQCPLLLL